MDVQNRNPKIYIICGKARHGKDTIAEMIRSSYRKREKEVLNIQYSTYIKEYAKKISNWDGSEETKPRELLQQLGTNVIRQNIDSLFFVNRILGDLQVYSYFFDCITISDARAKVEVDYPKKDFEHVIAIHVTRPNFDNGLTEEQKNHFTEVDLDDYERYDYEVVNDGSLEDLRQKIEAIVSEVEKQ